MRLCDFFCCCLSAPGENFDDDQRSSSRSTKVDTTNKKKSGKGIWKRLANPSKKKLRKEAKQLRNQMADRQKKEIHVMDIISEYEEEPMKAPRPRPVKWETLYENVDDMRIGNVVFHKAWVHATQHSQDAVSPEVHVGMPEGDTAQAQAQADIPLSIGLLEFVYANLSCGNQPSQASESPVLVPNAGDRELVQRHLAVDEKDEKKEKEAVLLEEERRQQLQLLALFQLAVFNTASATAAAQMNYIVGLLLSNFVVLMMQKLYSFINI
ncbi:uncharacterized protein LOC134439758 [Engraulis encrasicolus]|uniref:uncharacterized protein LOC134439758 n=1 Tax=Engraulis encrasicolus TaxID=184585 RepID=UPI002FD2FEE4